MSSTPMDEVAEDPLDSAGFEIIAYAHEIHLTN